MKKSNNNQFFTFLPDGVSFRSIQAAGIKTIYAPLCGADSFGLKSAITPSLSGDIKTDKYHYVNAPASREDLRTPSRDFFIYINKNKICSVAKESAPNTSFVTVGQLWHQVTRIHRSCGVELSALNFIPATNETVELMQVTVKNISKKKITYTPTAAIPIFARSLANKHDHEHVTALLNRVRQMPDGIVVEPTMAFNEEGHKEIHSVYFVSGIDDKNVLPVGSFPTVDAFFGDGGSMDAPEAVINNSKPQHYSQEQAQGKEIVGALRFKEQSLNAGQSKSYLILIGLAPSLKEAQAIIKKFNAVSRFEKALEANKRFWEKKTTSININSGDEHFNAWMRWVTLQPILRRIFGCSFLPDHDYGKGGKGWRDLWQDLLSLILIEPQQVRENLINNCAGIRIDGSNATIIGSKPGEFIADRNAITRVWMDHGAWPFLTMMLYVHQTGDFDILLEGQSYFRDPQLSRSFEKDLGWNHSYGNKLLDKKGHAYEGSIIEHLLLQNLVQFFNVGAHNIIRLESADWNDGLDMAFAKGESVAFSSFYAGNLIRLADLLEDLARYKKITTLKLAKEFLILLDTLSSKPVNYDKASEKHAHLFGAYFNHVQPIISGEQVDVAIADIVGDLRSKGRWIFGHIRQQEKLTVDSGGKIYQWFNGYYDNDANRVEGRVGNTLRMTLTGQVFSIMSGLANDEEIGLVVDSVKRFLKDKKLGGYRLNTDFGMRHYLTLGRAFGFAYGTKENGAFFSHMNVMYAYALYSRGRVRDGFEVIQSMYKMSSDGAKAKIYPGIPEYFDSEGRGMYHYLTGSASWLVLTVLTQVFGVRGHYGDLLLAPKLVKEQFDNKGEAGVTCQFAGQPLRIIYKNSHKLDVGKYKITKVLINKQPAAFEQLATGDVLIKRTQLQANTIIEALLEDSS